MLDEVAGEHGEVARTLTKGEIEIGESKLTAARVADGDHAGRRWVLAVDVRLRLHVENDRQVCGVSFHIALHPLIQIHEAQSDRCAAAIGCSAASAA